MWRMVGESSLILAEQDFSLNFYIVGKGNKKCCLPFNCYCDGGYCSTTNNIHPRVNEKTGLYIYIKLYSVGS